MLKDPSNLQWKAEAFVNDAEDPSAATGELRSLGPGPMESGFQLATGLRGAVWNIYEFRKLAFGSPALQQAAGPVFLGPRFAQTLRDGDRTFNNHAYGVSWLTHEMTHRWVANLRWKDPEPMAWRDPGQQEHWNPTLNTEVVAPVWSMFTEAKYREESNMGGMAVEETPTGGTGA